VTSCLLTAALIVRDEERVLDACLESISGIVDEIVIVDTGSIDRTPSIAQRRGARLYTRPWDDDFSAPRNLSLDHASGEWILYIDADERLLYADRDMVERLLVGAPEIAFRVLLRPHSAATAYLEYRLWRSDPRIRFEGLIHERVAPSIHRLADLEGRPITDCHLMLLDHIGYEGDQRRKHRRNLPMLTKFVQAQPDHLFAQHHLAVVLDGLDRPEESEAVLWRTVELIRARDTDDPAGMLAFTTLVRRLQSRDRPFGPLLAEARRRYPDNCVLLWIEGRDLAARHEYQAAIDRFDTILAIAAEGPSAGRPAYDQHLIGDHTHAARAVCLFRLQRFAEAAEAYGEAARCAPEDPTYPVKRQLALAKARAGSSGDSASESLA
jgi:glycosyltransferase involved in cell wall biosynthesis